MISSIFCKITLSVSHGSATIHDNARPSYAIVLEAVKFVEHGLLLLQLLLEIIELHPQGSFITTSVQQGFTGKKGYAILFIY
jgi:hypothetical protein